MRRLVTGAVIAGAGVVLSGACASTTVNPDGGGDEQGGAVSTGGDAGAGGRSIALGGSFASGGSAGAGGEGAGVGGGGAGGRAFATGGDTLGGAGAGGVAPIPDDTNTPGHEGVGVVICKDAGECSVAENKCCVASHFSDLDRCETSISCNSPRFWHLCDGPEDCPGGDCCGESFESNTCVDAGTCMLQLACHTDTDCPEGHQCSTTTSAADIAYCAPIPGDDTSTPGDDRAGWVSCDDVVDNTCEGLCCIPITGDMGCAQDACSAGTAYHVLCDGPEDCPSGQSCCQEMETNDCRDSCSATTICHTTQDCPTGQSCVVKTSPLPRGECE